MATSNILPWRSQAPHSRNVEVLRIALCRDARTAVVARVVGASRRLL
jgi:hypothetical protein